MTYEKGSCAEFVAVDVFQFKSDSVKPFSCIRIKVIIIINEIFHVRFAILPKTTEETCDKRKKPRNTAVATYFVN